MTDSVRDWCWRDVIVKLVSWIAVIIFVVGFWAFIVFLIGRFPT